MLKDNDAIATVAVKDLAAARHFYEDLLGFELSYAAGDAAREYRSGASKLLVYQSTHAGTNQGTVVTWIVDVDDTVRELVEKGITFEHYEFPGVTRAGDIHSIGDMKMAWFKDPDGNILALVGRR